MTHFQFNNLEKEVLEVFADYDPRTKGIYRDNFKKVKLGEYRKVTFYKDSNPYEVTIEMVALDFLKVQLLYNDKELFCYRMPTNGLDINMSVIKKVKKFKIGIENNILELFSVS